MTKIRPTQELCNSRNFLPLASGGSRVITLTVGLCDLVGLAAIPLLGITGGRRLMGIGDFGDANFACIVARNTLVTDTCCLITGLTARGKIISRLVLLIGRTLRFNFITNIFRHLREL
jgi:hypothetical protein